MTVLTWWASCRDQDLAGKKADYMLSGCSLFAAGWPSDKASLGSNSSADWLAKHAAVYHELHPQVDWEVAKADRLQRAVLRHLAGAQLAIEDLDQPTKWCGHGLQQQRKLDEAIAATQHVSVEELEEAPLVTPASARLRCLAYG